MRQSLEKTIGEKILELLLSFREVVKIIIIDPHLLNIKSRKISIIRSDSLFYCKIKELISKGKIINQLILLPDKSSLIRNKKIVGKLKEDSVVVDKIRNFDVVISNIKSSNIGFKKNIVVIDDIIDTGSTILKAVEAYLGSVKGSNVSPRFYIFCTHGVFSKLNRRLLSNSFISKVYLTPTLRRLEDKKIEYLDISRMLAKEISKIILK